jgi:hypothetical protein
LLHLPEGVEDAIVIGGRDADPGVAHHDLDRVPFSWEMCVDVTSS